MSWWIFLPAAYLAVAVNVTCGDALQWQGGSVDLIVLLWSVTIIRRDSRYVLMQSGLLGALRDLSLGLPLGLSSAVFTGIGWLIGMLNSPKQERPRNWLVWGFPVMLSAMTCLSLFDWFQTGMTSEFTSLVGHVIRQSVSTFLVGCLLGCLLVMGRRLVVPRREPRPSDLETTSFFLSR